MGNKQNAVLAKAQAQAVIRRPLTAHTWARSLVIPCGNFDGQTRTATSFSPDTSVFPCQCSNSIVLATGTIKGQGTKKTLTNRESNLPTMTSSCYPCLPAECTVRSAMTPSASNAHADCNIRCRQCVPVRSRIRLYGVSTNNNSLFNVE